MSGICGVVAPGGGQVDAAVLGRLVEAAAHRGPDGIGTWLRPDAALAHLALALAPEPEHQPVADGGVVLVADARLDNRPELAGWLPGGTGGGDAELILAAYQRWGTAAPSHLVGDFAFAVWDGPRRRLFAARDPMGMRTLYYRSEPRRTLFATEVAQILAVPGVPARIFEPMVASHLVKAFGPLEWTYYDGITALRPGHALLVEAGGHRTWPFWDPDPHRRLALTSPEEYAEQFRDLFLAAVRSRLRTTKPVGIMLSGGVDSTAVGATAGRILSGGGDGLTPEVRAYCWAFSELSQCDERGISGGVVEHYGLDVSDVPADDAGPLSNGHGPDRDDPFVGVYQPMWERALHRARGEGMGVVLTGGRGDVVVGGSVFDELGLLRGRRFAELRADLRLHRQVSGAGWPGVAGQLCRSAVAGVWPPSRLPGLRRRLAGPPPAVPAWVPPAFARRSGLADILAEHLRPRAPVGGQARRQRYEHIHDHLHVRGAAWLERLHARFGLASADPWSDQRLVEFVLAAPQWAIQRRSQRKQIARTAMRGIVPEAVARNAGKITPEPLLERALRVDARETVLDLVSRSRSAACGFVDEEALRDHYLAYLGGAPLDDRFWLALSLEMWLRRHWTVSGH